MFTTEGGVEIEEVAAKNPDALARLHVDPLEGYQPYQARRLIYGAGIDDPSEQKQMLDDHRQALPLLRRDATRCSARSTR